jgi:hypothetical protein
MSSTDVWLSLLLIVVLGEKLGGRLVDRSAVVLRIVLGALFLRSSRVCTTLLGQCERLCHTQFLGQN